MRKEILKILTEEHLSHIGSCIGMTKVLEIIYKIKRPKDIIILDAGHAHVAHLVAKEKYEGKKIKRPIQIRKIESDIGKC